MYITQLLLLAKVESQTQKPILKSVRWTKKLFPIDDPCVSLDGPCAAGRTKSFKIGTIYSKFIGKKTNNVLPNYYWNLNVIKNNIKTVLITLRSVRIIFSLGNIYKVIRDLFHNEILIKQIFAVNYIVQCIPCLWLFPRINEPIFQNNEMSLR